MININHRWFSIARTGRLQRRQRRPRSPMHRNWKHQRSPFCIDWGDPIHLTRVFHIIIYIYIENTLYIYMLLISQSINQWIYLSIYLSIIHPLCEEELHSSLCRFHRLEGTCSSRASRAGASNGTTGGGGILGCVSTWETHRKMEVLMGKP